MNHASAHPQGTRRPRKLVPASILSAITAAMVAAAFHTVAAGQAISDAPAEPNRAATAESQPPADKPEAAAAAKSATQSAAEPVAPGWHDAFVEIDEQRWFASERQPEVIFVGRPGVDAVTIRLSRAALLAGLELKLMTDAEQAMLTADEEQLAISLAGGEVRRLIFEGDRRHPTLSQNGEELHALRGRWIRILTRTDADVAVTLSLPQATYANITVVSPAPAAKATVLSSQSKLLSAASLECRSAAAATPRLASSETLTGTQAAQKRQRAVLRPTASQEASHRATIHRGLTPIAADERIVERNAWDLELAGEARLASAYYFRGIAQENQGFILELDADASLVLYDRSDNDVFNRLTIDMGFISHHHDGPSSQEITGQKWYEFDWYGGMSATFFKRWTLEARPRQRVGIEGGVDIHMLDVRVSFDDYDPRYDFQLSPYALFSYEYENQSDRGLRRLPGATMSDDGGLYLELGIRPGLTWVPVIDEHRPVMAYLPVSIGLSLDDYYEDLAGDDQTFGFFDIGIEIVAPLATVNAGADHAFLWDLTAGAHMLVLGSSLVELSESAGAGGDDVEFIGQIGLRLSY